MDEEEDKQHGNCFSSINKDCVESEQRHTWVNLVVVWFVVVEVVVMVMVVDVVVKVVVLVMVVDVVVKVVVLVVVVHDVVDDSFIRS